MPSVGREAQSGDICPPLLVAVVAVQDAMVSIEKSRPTYLGKLKIVSMTTVGKATANHPVSSLP